MQTLTVVNQMLGTMGEAPLNTLEDPHSFRGACLSTLTNESRRTQASGWWFNMETLTLNPQLNGRISLAGDCISVRTPTRNVTQRGRYLYDLDAGEYNFTSPIEVSLIRQVPFDELPETAAAYIAAESVLRFQMNYDADQQKTRALASFRDQAYVEVKTEHIRNRRSNFIESNTKLLRLKSLTNAARRLIR